ncbi:MAG TPA: DNA-binding domain-containing protein [Polyangiaceae bacterium]|nr:DNA-binding domain-containing protein [Polyangiaceae bacterium]
MTEAELRELQHWMANELRRRHDLGKDPETRALAQRYFTGNDRLSPVEQLEIYREQFWLRHTSSLVEDFPGLGGLIGQNAWQRLVEEYLAEHPPASRSLRDLGDRLPEFVARCTWLEQHELCIDMARLEWTYIELFDAADAPALAPEKLASLPEAAWQTARIVLNPALRLLRVRYPVTDLRRALKAAHAPVPIPAPASAELVLYRSRDRVIGDEPVTPGAFALLTLLGAGTPLVEACERVVHSLPAEASYVEENVGAWFQHWAERGWVVDVEV